MSADRRVSEALRGLFADQRTVFWQDVDREYLASVDALDLPENVHLLKLDERPALQVKQEIEADLAAGGGRRWLLYSNQAEPEQARDWLLDVRLRSREFRADGTSMLMEDLGLTTLSLAPHLKLRGKFLRAKDRVERLKRLVLPADDAEALDRKMMAVLMRTDEHDALSLAMRMLAGLAVPGEATVGEAPKVWSELEGLELATSFWMLMKLHLGYDANPPSLPDLLTRLLVTDFARGLRGPCPPAWAHLVLPDAVRAANASVLLARWRSDLQLHGSCASLSAAVAAELQLESVLAGMEVDALIDCVSFALVDRRIVSALKARVLSQGAAAQAEVKRVAGRRRDTPWANGLVTSSEGGDGAESVALAACYDALEAAVDFLDLKERHAAGLSFADAQEAIGAYRDELFRFDQLYRQLHHAAGLVEPMGWSLLHDLRDLVEQLYVGWFIPELATAWDKVIGGKTGLLSRWQVEGITAQQDFFSARVAPPLSSGSVQRLFVVISDALRYEVAEELARQINQKNRLVARLEPMLGVLPSYTALGMAALLPHERLAYREDGGVLVDGAPVATLEARDELLSRYKGLAIRADELLALGKIKGRERVKDRRFVYVYHDRIDMLGDKQGSEGQTFEAAAQTLAELQQVVGFIVNNLNASTVLVTADHGFLYQESALEEADKAALGDKPAGTVIAKKRYLLGQGLPANDRVWCGSTAITAGTTPGEGSLDFWLPRGAARFHFAGGARFVHGSAMPQEVLVPLLTVRESESATGKVKPVGLSLLGSSNKVVTNTQRFEFIQTEAVGARVVARTVLIALRNGQAPVSDEVSVTFDSTSERMDQRSRSVVLTVGAGPFNPHRDYHLVARDAQTHIEVLRVAVRIDLAFTNDF